MRLILAIVLLGVGLLTGADGALRLEVLSSIYRSEDIALTESPGTFLAWLNEVLDEFDADSTLRPPETRIAERLLTMPLERRRDIAVSMMQTSFWQVFMKNRQTPRHAQEFVRDGLIAALRKSPASGDLYTAAAWLEIKLDGFGSRGRSFLLSSHTYYPRELPFVAARLELSPLIWPLMVDEERALMKRDIETMRQVQPERAGRIESALSREGVNFL